MPPSPGDYMIIAAITHEIDEAIGNLKLKPQTLIDDKHLNTYNIKYRNRTIVSRSQYDNTTYISILTRPNAIRYIVQNDNITRTTIHAGELIDRIWEFCDPDIIDRVIRNIVSDILYAKGST